MTIPPETFQRMRDLGESDPNKLGRFWDELKDLERHEDTLINSRLQAFLVTTAFLVGAFSQFKDSTTLAVFMRSIVAVFGIVFALIMRRVLCRTAAAIEWYLERLIALDQILFDGALRPYETRRKEKQTQPRVAISRIISYYLPTAVLALWLLILAGSLTPITVLYLKKICHCP